MSGNPFASSQFGSHSAGDELDQLLRPQGGLAYVSGSRQDPLAFMTVPQLLDAACAENGAGEALSFPEQDISLSWYALRAQADALAAGLLALGIRRGNRVALWSPNRVEWVIAQFGTARIGAVLVNINPAYQVTELDYALNKVRARVLIMARAQRSSDYLAMLRQLAPEIDRPNLAVPGSEFFAERLPELKHVVVLGHGDRPPGTIAWDDLLRSAGPAHLSRLSGLSARLDPDDPINIQFTSGTTGSPKGAVLSHFNIVNNARYAAGAMQLGLRDRLCLPVPLYHCFGMVLGVLACASVGASVVFPGEGFDAGATLAAVGRYRCTALHGVPTMFIAMLDHPQFGQHDLSSLRTGIMAGAPCPVDTMQRVIADMHMEQVTIAYGMTETSPVSFQSSVNDPIEKRVSTVGRIQPHVEVKIVDQAGRLVPPGTEGELCTRGYCVMREYYEEPALTAQAIDPAGWMHTGDLAVIDTEGYCSIVGRVKDMLIRGGENVYPREIEEYLMTHSAIADAQVFGVPHERLGEQVCAWIILRPGQALDEDAVKAWCSGSIAHFKVPGTVRLVSEFPMTVTGKPQKFEMRKQMMLELGLTETRSA